MKLWLLEFVTDRFSVESRKAKTKKNYHSQIQKHKVLNETISELQATRNSKQLRTLKQRSRKQSFQLRSRFHRLRSSEN